MGKLLRKEGREPIGAAGEILFDLLVGNEQALAGKRCIETGSHKLLVMGGIERIHLPVQTLSDPEYKAGRVFIRGRVGCVFPLCRCHYPNLAFFILFKESLDPEPKVLKIEEEAEYRGYDHLYEVAAAARIDI